MILIDVPGIKSQQSCPALFLQIILRAAAVDIHAACGASPREESLQQQCTVCMHDLVLLNKKGNNQIINFVCVETDGMFVWLHICMILVHTVGMYAAHGVERGSQATYRMVDRIYGYRGREKRYLEIKYGKCICIIHMILRIMRRQCIIISV